MEGPLNGDMQQLQTLADEFGVTIQVSEKHITVLGIDGAVKEAAKELRNHATKCHFGDLVEPSATSRSAIMAAITKLQLKGGSSSNASTMDTLPTIRETADNSSGSGTAEHLMQGAVFSKMPPLCDRGSSQQTNARSRGRDADGAGPVNFCVHCGHPTEKIGNRIANFCAYCGKPTEQPDMQMAGGASAPRMDSVQMAGMLPTPMSYNGASLNYTSNLNNVYKSGVPYQNQGGSGQAMQFMPMQFAQSGMGGAQPQFQATSQDGEMMMCIPVGQSTPGLLAALTMGQMAQQRQWVPAMNPMMQMQPVAFMCQD